MSDEMSEFTDFRSMITKHGKSNAGLPEEAYSPLEQAAVTITRQILDEEGLPAWEIMIKDQARTYALQNAKRIVYGRKMLDYPGLHVRSFLVKNDVLYQVQPRKTSHRSIIFSTIIEEIAHVTAWEKKMPGCRLHGNSFHSEYKRLWQKYNALASQLPIEGKLVPDQLTAFDKFMGLYLEECLNHT
uniref:Uncharacterized protein n=1 Tax=viral metagenome TaxID=1070528 RepID=A0A6M3J9U8_9ZZZZ